MKKNFVIFSCQKFRQGVIMLVFAAMLGVIVPPKAEAQCETPIQALAAMLAIQASIKQQFKAYTKDAGSYITNLVNANAQIRLIQRLDEFTTNMINWLTDMANNRVLPLLKNTTKQLSIAQIDQTRNIGTMIDAQLIIEGVHEENIKEAEAKRRYLPSELACQVDSVGPAQTKAFQMSRALNRGFARDDTPRRANRVNSISATGMAAETRVLFDEYVAKFCDNTKGDQGCTTPGTLAGKHKDIPALLWGDKQTIDMSNVDNRLIVEASLRNLVYASSPDPIPPGAVASASGHQAILARRAEAARTNAIYNVMGQMVGERAGGSGLNMQTIGLRAAGGIPPADISTNASYREIQESMTKDRFHDPKYVVNMIANPEQVAREQGAINALRLQMLNDIYRRYEELLFMTAADYSRDLDRQIPLPAVHAAPLK